MSQPSLPELITVFEDDALVVVNKPAGLLSVPGKTEKDSVESRVQAFHPRARLVHRLDQPTSGLLVFALGYENQVHLQKQFAARTVEKRYIAHVHGLITADAGEIDLPLICDWPNRPRQKVCFEHGKPSLTRYQVIYRDPAVGVSRVALFPVTGRSHQLRVHLQQLGHPILGDAFYAPADVVTMSPRLLLHAEHLAFHHPVSGEQMTFEAPAPF